MRWRDEKHMKNFGPEPVKEQLLTGARRTRRREDNINTDFKEVGLNWLRIRINFVFL
jgi:hypothetical protein